MRVGRARNRTSPTATSFWLAVPASGPRKPEPERDRKSAVHRADPRSRVAIVRIGGMAAGPGDPIDALLRHSWHAVAVAADIGGAPVPVTLLGERLVLARLDG